MKKFEARTLEEAYAAAAKEFSCSVTELDIQVVQNPSRGFLGFGRKNAVIVALRKSGLEVQKEVGSGSGTKETAEAKKRKAPKKRQEDKREGRGEPKPRKAEQSASEERRVEARPEEPASGSALKEENRERKSYSDEDIFDNFYDDTIDIHSVVSEVESEINRLFSSACFKIEPIRVFALDDETLQIEFKGEDAALLIGKEGYRYKAMAYLLYNWIHGRYGYKIRLEIAEFLQNQEAMMESYLQPVIERIESEGRAQTKVLDGILVQIALQKLRERYPQKYVAVRTNKEGGRYVIVNEFMERR